MMKRFLLIAILALAPLGVSSAAPKGEMPLGLEFSADPYDTDSIRRGAGLFVNYCMGCHSVELLRWNRMAADLGMEEEDVIENMIFGDAEIHDPMVSAMDPEDGEAWFGIEPPDLSLTGRSLGADWIYAFLNTFYRDDMSAVGIDNMMLGGSSMPHVLSSLQGMPEAVRDDDGNIVDLVVPEHRQGVMSPEEYRQATADIANFLAYAAEPVKAYRMQLGFKVILFLLLLSVVFYALKREYWKDVH